MQRFISFLIEKNDGGYEFSKGKAPSGALKRGIIDPVVDYAKEVGSGIAADPVMFTKEFAKSMFTDPETYHSAFAFGGTVPVAGEIFDVADAGLYASQGDTEMAKLSLASAFPAVGAIGNIARTGRSVSKIKQAEEIIKQRAEALVPESQRLLRQSTNRFNPDADVNRRLLTTHLPNTERNVTGLRDMGAIIPKPEEAITVTWEDILKGVYGKDAPKYAKLADRAQRKAVKSFEIAPQKVSEFIMPDYTPLALNKEIDFNVGTHLDYGPQNPGTSILRPNEGFAFFDTTQPGRVNAAGKVPQINFDIHQMRHVGQDFPGIAYHEGTHAMGHLNPRNIWSRWVEKNLTSSADIRAAKTDVDRVFDAETLSGQQIPRWYTGLPSGGRINPTNYGLKRAAQDFNTQIADFPRNTLAELEAATSPSDLSPKSRNAFIELMRRGGNQASLYDVFDRLKNTSLRQTAEREQEFIKYMSNQEIPGQIASVKAWMQSKGLPNINSNMSYDEAKGLGRFIMDKYNKGYFNTKELTPNMLQMIDTLEKPEGKKLFDLIARNKSKGSQVNQKINQAFA